MGIYGKLKEGREAGQNIVKNGKERVNLEERKEKQEGNERSWQGIKEVEKKK